MNSILSWPRRGLLTFVALTLLISVWVAAAGPGPLTQTLAYQGRLELGGVPFNGLANMEFALYDDANPTNSTLSWTETRDVGVTGGAFSLRLGELTPIPAAAFEAAELFLGIVVDGTPLAGLQRLDPAWAAHRAERAVDFSVSGTLNVGAPLANTGEAGELTVRARSNDADYNIASFLAENETQGVGVTWRGLQKIGSNVASSLHLAPKALGELTTTAIRTDETGDNLYETTLTRWVIEANYNPSFSSVDTTSRVVPLDDARLRSFCADIDGCTVRLIMADYNAGPTQQVQAAAGPYHFSLKDVPNFRGWRISETANLHELKNDGLPERTSGITGVDGDSENVTNHVISAWNCFFTEAAFTPGGSAGNDSAIGFALLNFNRNLFFQPRCVLIIDD